MRDPVDYTLHWPSQLLEAELRRLLLVAESEGATAEWSDEASILLRQGFLTTVPAEDFEQIRAATWLDSAYGDEEPF